MTLEVGNIKCIARMVNRLDFQSVINLMIRDHSSTILEKSHKTYHSDAERSW